MEIVPRVRADNDHDEEVASVVEIAIADRRLEEFAVFCDPLLKAVRRQNGGACATFRMG